MYKYTRLFGGIRRKYNSVMVNERIFMPKLCVNLVQVLSSNKAEGRRPTRVDGTQIRGGVILRVISILSRSILDFESTLIVFKLTAVLWLLE